MRTRRTVAAEPGPQAPPVAAPRPPLSVRQVAQLRAISLCCDKAIVRWWTGQPVRQATAERLSNAAAELGIAC